MSDVINSLSAPLRPGSIDVRGQQPSLFPFDAFIYDDPNRVEAPKLKMRPPWELVSSGLEVYEDGVDPDNLQDGDRRLIIEGEVLKLQHWEDPPGEWVDDISLGGYDADGNFIDYINAKGIVRPDDVGSLNYTGGHSIPIHYISSNEFTQFGVQFFNANGDARKLGETTVTDTAETSYLWNGKPMLKASAPGLVGVVENLYGTHTLPNDSRLPSTYSASQSGTGVMAFRFQVVDPLIPDVELGRFVHYGECDQNLSAITYSAYTTGVVQILSGDLVLKLDSETKRNTTSLGTDTDTITLVSGVVAEQVYSVAFGLNFSFAELASLTNIALSPHVRGYYFVDGVDTWYSASFSEYYPGDASASTHFSKFRSNMSTRAVFSETAYVTTDMLIEASTTDPYTGYGSSFGPGTERTNLIVWSGGDRWFSLQDDETDIMFRPKEDGRVIIIGAELVSGIEDTILTGPAGSTGPAGPQGEQGIPGNSHVDGGSASSIYQPDQIIDGGNA